MSQFIRALIWIRAMATLQNKASGRIGVEARFAFRWVGLRNYAPMAPR